MNKCKRTGLDVMESTFVLYLRSMSGEDRLKTIREVTDGMCVTILGCGEDHGEDCTCNHEGNT